MNYFRYIVLVKCCPLRNITTQLSVLVNRMVRMLMRSIVMSTMFASLVPIISDSVRTNSSGITRPSDVIGPAMLSALVNDLFCFCLLSIQC